MPPLGRLVALAFAAAASMPLAARAAEPAVLVRVATEARGAMLYAAPPGDPLMLVCRAPCDTALPPGATRFAVASGDEVKPVERAVLDVPRGPARVEIRQHRYLYARIPMVVAGVPAAAWGVSAMALAPCSASTDPTGRCPFSPEFFAIGLATAIAGVGLVTAAVLIPNGYSVEIAPLAPRVSRAPGPPEGLSLRVRF